MAVFDGRLDDSMAVLEGRPNSMVILNRRLSDPMAALNGRLNDVIAVLEGRPSDVMAVLNRRVDNLVTAGRQMGVEMRVRTRNQMVVGRQTRVGMRHPTTAGWQTEIRNPVQAIWTLLRCLAYHPRLPTIGMVVLGLWTANGNFQLLAHQTKGKLRTSSQEPSTDSLGAVKRYKTVRITVPTTFTPVPSFFCKDRQNPNCRNLTE
jgi:hypothetical protein